MLIILSQKVDSKSTYDDQLFHTYHYPARYRNQIHQGDIFVYYQGNRYDKTQRYYFGVGKIGEIIKMDDENYYAQLIDCRRFEKPIPIYLPDEGYIEQLGYETVRKSVTPPWQSSVRPLSQKAYDYILNMAGEQVAPEVEASVEILEARLKKAVREYYVEKDETAIMRIESIASAIGRMKGVRISTLNSCGVKPEIYAASENSKDRLEELIEYCQSMKMSYSYKPILIMALFQSGNRQGAISIKAAAKHFRKYYKGRKDKGLCIERKRCIYCKDDVTEKQIMENIIANPVNALVKSGYFFYNPDEQEFLISPEIWQEIDHKSELCILRICRGKLKKYYGD